MRNAELTMETIIKLIIVVAVIIIALLIVRPLINEGAKRIINWKIG
jgi:hypothetical protein